MDRINRNLLANISSNIIIVFLTLLATPIYVNLLGIEKYSLIGIYFTLITILGIIDTGITSVISREIAFLTSRYSKNNLIGSTFFSFEIFYWIILLFVGFVMIIFFTFFWELFINSNLNYLEVSQSLILIILAIIFQLPSNYYIGALMGLQKQVIASKINVIFHSLRIFSSILIIIYTQDLRIFFLNFIFISILQTFISRYIAWNNLKIYTDKISFSFKNINNVKNFAIGISIITALSVITSNVDKFYVSKNFNLEILGYYLLCWSVASGLFRLGIPVMQAFAPHFAELFSLKKFNKLKERFLLSNKLIFILIIPISVTIYFNSKIIIFIWTQNIIVANNSEEILSYLILGSMFSICAYPSLSLLYSQKKYKNVLIFHIAGLIISILYYQIFLSDKKLYISYYYVAFYGFVFMLYFNFSVRFIGENSKILMSFISTFLVAILVNVSLKYLFTSENYVLNILLLIFIVLSISIIIILINKEFKIMAKQFVSSLKY